MSELYIISVFIICFFCFLLGALVLVRNRKNLANIFFFLLTIFISFWILSNLLVDYLAIADLVLFWSRATNFFAVLLVYFLLCFIFFFPRPLNTSALLLKLFLFPVSLFLIISISELHIQSIELTESGNSIILGSLSELMFVFFFFMLIVSFIILLRKFIESRGLERAQVKFISLGLGLSVFLVLFFSGFVPLVFGTPETAKISPITTIFFIGFTSYAIIKHRLMDIRFVVARSVVYSLLLVMLAGFYSSSIFFIQELFFDAAFAPGYIFIQIVLATAMAFMFQPLRRWLTKITDSIFFKEQYNTEELLDKVAHSVSSSIILVEVLYRAIDSLLSQMKIDRGVIYVFSEAGRVIEPQSIGCRVLPKVASREIFGLTHDGVLVVDEISEESNYKKTLSKLGFSVAIPLKSKSGVSGVFLLGEKKSGEMFNANDIKVFEIIGPEISMAIENAKSYEKIEKFNITLRQEIKKAVAELEKKNEQLKELDRAKDEFISMASHQLRTPLTAIKGYLSMLLEGDAGEVKLSQYDFVNEAFQGANRMVGLINDLLNVSRMETGRFFLDPKETNMENIVREEVGQLKKQAKEKGLKLEIDIKGKIPKAYVDEIKIRQVVMNFADNAIYYTNTGSVVVSLENDKKSIIYKVKDTGIGVPKLQQKNLFSKFFRADNARHVRPDGTGLGIYLAKKVIDDHGGKMIFSSSEGKGSTFGFEIPIKSKLKTKRVSAPSPVLRSVRPEIGELAAGTGTSPATIKESQDNNGRNGSAH